jgi:pimeloyl-ACP methyl ester carboxylesterase
MKNLSKLIIRPIRETYNPDSDLGPKNFILKGKVYTRNDLTILNSRGQKLQCSWFSPKFSDKESLFCIVYCHGNCGSRCDAIDIAKALLPIGISVFALDFSGSGLSEGEFVSLGYYESQDLKTVVDYIKSTKKTVGIGLWGRSMGAACSILYASNDPDIGFLILDSPFTSLREVSEQLISSYKIFPKKLFDAIFSGVRQSIVDYANFDLLEVSPVQHIDKCHMPAIFLHATKDQLVSVSQSRELYEKYPGDKYLLELGGGHNSTRPAAVLERVVEILTDIINAPNGCPEVVEEGMKTIRAVPPSFRTKSFEKDI